MELVKCPHCDVKSSVEAWDEATENIYGGDETECESIEAVLDGSSEEPDDMYWFACPACGEDSICGDTIAVAQDDMEDEE